MDVPKQYPSLIELHKNIFSPHLMLCIFFFCSGCAALIYQLMWERMLFSFFGIDLESITIIVSVFMFGLGVGGLGGGWIADHMPTRLLLIYICIELGIALFGFISPNLIQMLQVAIQSSNKLTTFAVSFLFLSFPTILMGATFPILVSYVNNYIKNIGHSVGELYFSNTLGGVAGVFLTGFVLIELLDIPHVIYFAAFLNLTVAIVACLIFRRAN